MANIIELKPLESGPIAKSKDDDFKSHCPHDSFTYSDKQRRIWCMRCKVEIDSYQAFKSLVFRFARTEHRLEAIREFEAKERARENLKKDRLLEKERLRPQSEQIRCYRCSNLVIQKRRGDYLWLECLKCGSGWSKEAFDSGKEWHEANRKKAALSKED